LEENESVIARLRNDLESWERESQKKGSELRSAEAEMAGLLGRIAELESIEREYALQVEQLKRERALARAEAKSEIVTAESDFHAKLEEQKTQWQNEKRRVLAFVIDQFRQFFDPQSGIEEDAFQGIVLRAKEEITRLMQSDQAVRRLVGADPRQKTEEAVGGYVRR
jgi:chromosome segregation ATPase